MKAYHVVGEAPMYTNTFLLISDAGHAAVIDPAAAAEDYNKLLKKEGAALTDILCTHGHFDHVGSAAELKEQWHARLWCEKADLGGGQFFPLQAADSGYEEGGVVKVDEMEFTGPHPRQRLSAVRAVSFHRGHPLCGQRRPHRPARRQHPPDERVAAQAGRPAHPGAGAGPAGARGPFHLWGGAETQLVHQERVQTGLTQP